MSRPLRIQYPDAWYHVMNRGRRGEKVFEGNNDYNAFIDLLKELVEGYNLKIAAGSKRFVDKIKEVFFLIKSMKRFLKPDFLPQMWIKLLKINSRIKS